MSLRPKSVRVAVIVPVRLYREGLAGALGRRSGLEVVLSQADWRESLAVLSALAPDVILLDMTPASSRDLGEALRRHALTIPVVGVATGDSERELTDRSDVQTTASLTSDASLDELAEALRWAAHAEAIRSKKAAQALVRRETRWGLDRSGVSLRALTRREREIGSLLERDFTNKEIAARLGIERATVKNHVHNLLEKLRVHRRSQAARLLGGAHRASASNSIHGTKS